MPGSLPPNPAEEITVSDIYMAIIDGTGEADDAAYTKSMQHSFCRQLANRLGERHALYVRGPSAAGTETPACAQEAFTWLQRIDACVLKSHRRLMLAGYSRGGSAAIMVAEMLAQRGIEVDSLFLFDAVARHASSGGEVIPANVRFSRHARRDQSLTFVLRYESTFSDLQDSKVDVLGLANFFAASNPTRPTFGNTGLTWYGDGDHQVATAFKGSHGALGGVGWSFVQEDTQCQEDVARFMNGHLAARNVPVKLVAVPPEGPQAAPGWGAMMVPGAILDLILLGSHSFTTRAAGPRTDVSRMIRLLASPPR